MNDELPTVKQELERKTVEFLEQQLFLSERGQISKADLHLAGRAAWSLTCGLVSSEVTEMCTLMAEQGAAQPMKRSFAGRGEVKTITWRPEGAGFVVATLETNAAAWRKNPVKSAQGELESTISKLADKLLQVGYLEI